MKKSEGRIHPLHRRAAHHCGRRQDRGRHGRGQPAKAPAGPGELHCIGATTLNEYRQYIEKDAALERRFQPVLVAEPTVEDTIAILRGLKERYEVYPRREDYQTAPSSPPPPCPTAISPTASSPTRPSTSSTRPAP